ncbi:MAG: DNA-processing protein DprA [Gemmatimonadota bacterium]|nr:DNA-processing protein DprA [Gemmatimonadota bacterium]
MTDSPESCLRDMLRLMLIPRVGPVTLARLLKVMGGPGEVVRAGYEKLKRLTWLSNDVLDVICARRWNEGGVENQLERIKASDTKPLFIWQNEYPAYLAQIYDPPPMLFVRGNIESLNLPCFAIVGTRGPSLYGRQMASSLASGLSAAGFTVVSGLARGIDSIAHSEALDAGGSTLAVLGCGTDVIYPPENAGLAEKIIETRGALVSEYLMGTRPEGQNFPRRNRLISGLSRGVLVVEGSAKSGALITAAYAADQNREVFALPGDVTRKLSHGANRLIQQGAKLVLSAGDILSEFGAWATGPAGEEPEGRPAPSLSREERVVFDCLSNAPVHVDELAGKLGMDISAILAILLRLEVKQLIREHPGKLYSLG